MLVSANLKGFKNLSEQFQSETRDIKQGRVNPEDLDEFMEE